MFYDPVESTFYAWCVERLLTSSSAAPYLRDGVVELGAGSGLPIVEALRRCEVPVQVRGFERDPESFRMASRLVALKAPPGYSVEPGDFFDQGLDGPERVAIANPPYLAAPTGDTSAPELWGGESGAEVTRRLLSGPFDVLMLMMASIADPLGVIDHAACSGYLVADWCARPIPFGRHSREPVVHRRLRELHAEGRAFSSEAGYLLAGVTLLRAGRRGRLTSVGRESGPDGFAPDANTLDPNADVLRGVMAAGASVRRGP
ncbi:hypothetical protein Ga0074812_13221 [Parafrankia irregularis]|uniref:Methyltransferase small domain-containing protein n=2 Tax=Frankiaceae TaxID=74712 RepID=A0A0S4QYI0_9ACTN|nr:methyltransferase [Parafrankia sp. CH37]CUU59816.1 hypothetical protein Ga0074812_13221 [Parafrankia irregularis]